MDRILATHTGSLIRPPELLEFLAAKDSGKSYDEDAYQRTLKEAVNDQVRRQAEAGIDIVNDGEWGKPSYATYIKDRLNGFGGTGNTFVFQDIEAFPQMIPGALRIAMEEIEERHGEIPRDRDVVLYCS